MPVELKANLLLQSEDGTVRPSEAEGGRGRGEAPGHQDGGRG